MKIVNGDLIKLTGGDWQVISEIIDQELQGEDFTLVKYVRD